MAIGPGKYILEHYWGAVLTFIFLQDISRREHHYGNAKLVEAGNSKSIEMHALQFQLAVVLCHETANAIHTASDFKAYEHVSLHWRLTQEHCSADKLTENEPYFEDSWIAEVGYAWEQRVFGVSVPPNPSCTAKLIPTIIGPGGSSS